MSVAEWIIKAVQAGLKLRDKFWIEKAVRDAREQ